MGGKIQGSTDIAVLRQLLDQRTEELRDCRARLCELEQRVDQAQPDRELEHRVRQAVDETREKDNLLILRNRQAAMGEMIGNIAHQWRQPLTAISLLIQDLRECYEYGEFSREYLDKNVGDALGIIRNMSRTLNDCRDLFGADRESRVFSVRESLERSVSFIESSLRCHNITVTIETDDGLTATGYPNEFSQAILTILGLAREAFGEMEPGEPLIRICAFREGDRTVVTITDNGGCVGEPPAEGDADPYRFGRSPEKELGLSLARTIIERNMGGRLTAGNAQTGARFRIEI